MPNFTPNYNLAKPLVNSAVDQDLWGGELNGDMDIIDTAMADLQTQISGLSGSHLPIGSIYMNYSDSTNPATLLGYGTWSAITDKFVVARGSTYTSTGGAATATLSVANLPSTLTLSTPNVGDTNNGTIGNVPLAGVDSGARGTRNLTATISGASNTGFSIIPPYQAVYMWYRSA